MGYAIWDMVKGGPANRRRYWTLSGAEKRCDRINEECVALGGLRDRFYVKAL